LWPTKVEEIKTTASVDAVFTGNLLNTPEKVDNSYEVEFYPYTTVELNVPGAGNATIYYYIADTDESLDDDSKVKWNEYAQPFPVIKSCYIHAKAIRPGYEESVHTHIDFTLAQPAGTVEFDVDPQTGKTVVTMTAAEGAEIYWTEGNTAPLATWEKYTGPVPFTQATRIWAYAKEGGKTGTPVSMYVMIQPEGDTTVKDPAQVSGKPVITHRLTEDKTPMITIQPEDESLAEGTYTIHYTTDGRTPTVNSTVYTGEFAMPKEGGLVLAILKENAKQHPSDVAHLNVSYIPTDIDGIDSDRNGSDVRAEGDSIIAPEGSEVYDINGRRVAATGLRSGIYIVKVPGAKAVKVKVD
ncbi:MAG: chitobiase/beta-hexosaminidase C-terminal domain-containing protein, partial [Paramuribaculum sp.]|nr:chitobiase/beta-hexosaminidase C-terminal domain-containing protein [Paramuribaculum sp.]